MSSPVEKRQNSLRLSPKQHSSRANVSRQGVPPSLKDLKSQSNFSFRGSSHLEAAVMAVSVEENDTTPQNPPDGKTFAASYWKQQVIASKRKLSAVVDRHSRDVYDVHHKLHRNIPDVTLPQIDHLECAREATLRKIVSKPVPKGDTVRNKHHYILQHGSSVSSPNGFHRLKASNPAVEATDLKHLLRFQETKHSVTKLATRFSQRMHWLSHSHRSAILRRMHQILVPQSAAMATSVDVPPVVQANTSTPPKFILQESAMDLAIASFKTKLGIEQPTASNSTDDLLQQLRRDFGTLFARHVAPYQSDGMARKATPMTSSVDSSDPHRGSLFPQVPTSQRQQRIGLMDKKQSNCMVLEAELKFCSASEAQHVLDRLEGLAASHVKRALLTIDAVELRSNSASLTDRLGLVEPPNAPSLPDAKVKAYYILRLLWIRQCKHRMVGYLNYFRSIEAHVLVDWHDMGHENTSTTTTIDRPTNVERFFDRVDDANEMQIVDHVGRPFLYSTAWDELMEIEQDMLCIGSAVSSFDERDTLKAGTERKVVTVVDRVSVLGDLYECESWYLEAKFKLVRRVFEDVYMRAYGHDAQRHQAQALLDLVAARPLVDLAERYFWDAYVSQVMALEIQAKALRGVGEVNAALADPLFTTAEAAVIVRTSTRQAIAAMDTSMHHLSVIERLAMHRAVHEQAMVCWHVVSTEEREYVTASSTIHCAVFTNYYSKDSGVGTLVEQAANDVYRRNVKHDSLVSDRSIHDQVHHLGTEYVETLSRAVWFFKLQCDLAQQVYATGLLEALHASQMLHLYVDDVLPAGNPTHASVLDQTPAIEALPFVSVLRTTSTLEWIGMHLNESQLRWLTLTVHVQEAERVYLEETLGFNAMLLQPIFDFEASHPKLMAKHVAKFLSTPHINQNHKNFLAQVQSVLGQRALHDKVTTRIQVELKATAAFCVHADAHRQSVRALVTSRVDMHPDVPMTDHIVEYMTDLMESVQMEGLVTQLNAHLDTMRVISRDLPASTINPFVVGGFADRDTLEAWLLRELSPMEEQLGVATTTVVVDGVKMAKGETIETLWCAAQGDIVSMQYIPHPHELLKRFTKTDVANGRVVFRLARQYEPEIRRILALYTALVAVIDTLVFRAALHRQAPDDVLGGELRDLLHQMHHDCFSRLNDVASSRDLRHVNDVMLEWLQTKREFLHVLRATALKAIVNDILAASITATPPPPSLVWLQYSFHEGQALVQNEDSRSIGAATTQFITGLSTHDCTAARQWWKLLETRASPVGGLGVAYLKKIDAFHALRQYFLQIPVMKEASQVDKAVELQAILATEAVARDVSTTSAHRNSMPPSLEFQVPEPVELDHMIDNLRNRIELHLVDQDIVDVRSQFASVLKSLGESPSPRRQAVVVGQAKLDPMGIFVNRVQETVETAIANKESYNVDLASLCRTFMEAYQDSINFRQAATTTLNVQLRHRIAALEDATSRLESQRRRQDTIADQVLATSVVDKAYKIIFELEEARHAIDMAGEELDVQKAKIISEIRSEYDSKLRDMNLELIQKHGQFEEYRAAVQNVSMIMYLSFQNTALKQTLMKLRTMYDLKDAATHAAHDKAEATLSAQLAKANLVFHQKTQVDGQLAATQTQVVALQKELLRAQSVTPTTASTSATSAIHKEPKSSAVKTALHVTKFANRLVAQQKAKAVVARAVGEPIDGMDEDDDEEDEEDLQPREGDRRTSSSPRRNDDAAVRTRAHYIRSAHHLNREIHRLQQQLAKEVKLKTAALDQLQAARGHAHVQLEHENTKLHTELVDTQRRYVAAVQEIGELQHLISPEPCGHTTARSMAAAARHAPSPLSADTPRRPRT
ncbi:hypothetical protein DYB38_002038 [Aphanomyces astaci]|uniref:Uncharacterized protein n=1 Tax=Aphanomyces astaci TaxID=112090 RepID=A0A397CYY2_APHAT|nr:hypothetical protein DYB38_002038 [Aphanomyces astaci]